MIDHQDEHRVSIPSDWTAADFATNVLNGAPLWLRRAIDLRDRVVGKLGFAVQPDSSGRVTDLRVGSSAGPFTFTEVDAEIVRGGNGDKHIWFESSFRVEPGLDGSRGVLRTETGSHDRIGRVYLLAVWPAHRLLMSALLRQAIRNG